MEESGDFCRICLQSSTSNSTIFVYKDDRFAPDVIYNISGVKISSRREPEAKICDLCIAGVFAAETIIMQCQETQEFLLSQTKTFGNAAFPKIEDDNVVICERLNKIQPLDDQQHFDFSEANSMPPLKNTGEVHDNVKSTLIQPKKNLDFATVAKNSMDFLKEEEMTFSNLEFCRSSSSEFLPGSSYMEQLNSNCSTVTNSTESSKTETFAKIKAKLQNISEQNDTKRKQGRPEKFRNSQFLHKCEFCEYASVTRKCFINHLLLIHNMDDSSIYPCALCPEKFSWRRLLFKHVEQVHKQLPAEKKFMCDECGKTYTQEIHLLDHRKQLHESICHKCPHPGCKSKFNRVSSLRRHFNNLHTEMKRHYCEACDKHFSVWDNWRYHLDVVHQHTKMACPKCLCPFRNQKQLQKHMLMSACEKWAFPCKNCDRRFPAMSGLKSHVKNIHSENAEK